MNRHMLFNVHIETNIELENVYWPIISGFTLLHTICVLQDCSMSMSMFMSMSVSVS